MTRTQDPLEDTTAGQWRLLRDAVADLRRAVLAAVRQLTQPHE